MTLSWRSARVKSSRADDRNADQVVHLPHLWKADGSLLRERLLEAPTPQAKLAVFEETLLQHLAPSHDPAIGYAVTALQYGVPVAESRVRVGPAAQGLCAPFFQSGGHYTQAVCSCPQAAEGFTLAAHWA